MKMAEALMERKAAKTKMEELRRRIYQHAQVEQGGKPVEDPLTLLQEMTEETRRFEAIVARINTANHTTRLADGTTLAETVLRRDMLRYVHLTVTNLAAKAAQAPDRYSPREIKNEPAVSVADLHRRADALAKEIRLLDATVQQANWQIEL